MVTEKALQGIKVLDLTRVLAGPYVSMVLGDLGAEVIKIETPQGGDDSRGYGPFINGESVYFMSLNRNKKSLSLNLKSEEGKEIFLRMVQDADVVLENYRPGTMEKLGLGYEELERVNPKIIYAASSGFGHTGPYSKRAAYDLIVQGMGGIMSLTGEPDGTPTRVGASIGDITSGLFTTIGILSAIHKRGDTGKGQKVDVAMLDCQVAILENAIARYAVDGQSPKATGNRHPSITPFAVFKANNGHIIVAAGNDALWKKWCQAVGREELAEDNRFTTNALRTDNWDELETIMGEVIAHRSVEEWLQHFDQAGIPASPIHNVEQVIKHPQVISREMVVHQQHPVAGEIVMPGIPIKLSKTPGTIDRPAPLLGQHTLEILSGLGFEEAVIEEMRAKGIV
ncbi:CaiB/BaiF CoA-transferase family protein [Aneurinibacillus sp. Ricciae_BoGa-3]|uniref:CaiB/BaiF CoA transferase family protein n=1 Tax=Aneurinibacillus sp. Ricciae_BoGa-3 TaxID=3022697 RepID=UPI002340115B|nr:CaiB/BaiF CoA-transferase family protein [Aneurinibacillus sp. Ricciae_BoGa-3]WCK56628.1 CaiB/BaiF CoA-transferase family protein [Aneurinibacillus sp. Ricciae_BoGa-3]